MCLNIFDNVIRRGNVLDFFHKPDVASYGGDYNERINTYGVMALRKFTAYLSHQLGLQENCVFLSMS